MRITALLIFSVAFAATNCNALAGDAGDGEWVMYVEKANGDQYFYDPSRVERIDTLRHVWSGIRYKTSVMGASSFLSFLEINCSEQTQKILQSTFFTDAHWENAAMKTDTKQKPKKEIAVGSATERLAQIVCS
ncbi:surface-adhesin E family protein [Sulfitobacter sp. MF3-043]|uniref:surface-adhesin E family protein n=1 Tax=Sulfitobacter sediminivivens TaxID=3252902 RepID=UPI003EC07BB6